MVDLLTSFGAGVLATFLPLYLGLVAPRLVTLLKPNNPKPIILLAAASAGIIFWFFLDVMGDAARLDIDQGFGGDYTHVVLALLFAIGVVALFGLERASGRPTVPTGNTQNTLPTTLTFAVAATAALGIGFHALGEGMQIGAQLPNAESVLEAIGGISPGVAYVLHKFLEGFVLGVFALLAPLASGRKIGVLGAIAGIPTIIGFFIGLPASVDSSYFFALGGAGALYVEAKLLPVFARTRLEYASVIPILLGFYSMYIAGLFHA